MTLTTCSFNFSMIVLLLLNFITINVIFIVSQILMFINKNHSISGYYYPIILYLIFNFNYLLFLLFSTNFYYYLVFITIIIL